MEPLLPASRLSELAELSCEILRCSNRLLEYIPSHTARRGIAHLVRGMNSYYSNLIEGHKTLPRDIESALQSDFSDKPTERDNQHLAAAHIQVEELMRERLLHEPEWSIHSPEFICWVHREFYQRLPDHLQFTETHRGRQQRLQPGVLRDHEVTVGAHQPPASSALPEFMRRFEQFYSSKTLPATSQLMALAAGHHRLAWIHPFGDGNGRVARLHSHAWLIRCQADAGGLWTISRGLARQRQGYYLHLRTADQQRQGDFDGRGNLSDRGLAEFCVFFLRSMLDQIEFMSELLQLPALVSRIEAHLHLHHGDWSLKKREQAARVLREGLIVDEIERGRVSQLAGISDTTARGLIHRLMDEGFMTSTTPKGPLRLRFSTKVLETWFPKLYQDLPLGTY
ncbi:Fic family protein [Prosthecobacter sp.]|uniref:Fic family protein n=1 Tax=Prosthecobacter sp. TaxID=1965333 RepID=UPI003783798F